MQQLIINIVSQEVLKAVAEATIVQPFIHRSITFSEACCNIYEPYGSECQHDEAQFGGDKKPHYTPEVHLVGHSMHTLHIAHKVKDGILVRSIGKH